MDNQLILNIEIESVYAHDGEYQLSSHEINQLQSKIRKSIRDVLHEEFVSCEDDWDNYGESDFLLSFSEARYLD